MDIMILQAETDAEGAAVSVGSVSPRRVYAIGWDGTDLGTDATMTLVATVPLAGDATLLSLADADTSGLYYPRVYETDEAGADLDTTAMLIVDSLVTLTIAAGGSGNVATCTLYLV